MKILLLHSPSTKGGTERIADFLRPEIEVDFAANRPGNTSEYDGIILHNRIDVKPGEPTAIYPCGKPTARMIEKPEYLARAVEHKPKAIWTNSHTSTLSLAAKVPDVRILYMPKPFVLTIPDKCPPMPSDKRILWYWRRNWQYTEKIDSMIADMIVELADQGVEIWVISNKGKPIEHGILVHPNVRPMGRIDIPNRIHEISGMVRVSEGLDYGRITYQIMAYGRWCIYVGMREPHVICAQSYKTVLDLTKNALLHQDAWAAEERRKYIAENFSEEALSKKWQAEVMEVFGG